MGASSGEGFQQQEPPGTGAPSNRDSPIHMVCLNPTSRTRTAVDREARVHQIAKNCKWEQLTKVEKMMKTDGYPRLRDMVRKVNGPKLRYGPALDTRDFTKTKTSELKRQENTWCGVNILSNFSSLALMEWLKP